MRGMVVALLVSLLLPLGCTDPQLAGTCVGSIDYVDEPQIVPNLSPFVMCPKAPGTLVYGNFILQNCGRQALKIESFSISNEGAEVFSDLEIPEKEVNPGEDTAARFAYNSVDLLEHRGEITIKSNSGKNPTFKMDVVVRSNEPFDGGWCDPVTVAEDGGSED